MLNFTHYSPTRFIFGRDAELQAGAEIKALGGTRVLIHYGGGSAVRSGLIERVEKSVREAGLYCISLGGAQPNPRDTKVYEGIELIRREEINFILAVGGGSTIDSSKAMAHGACYDGDFWDFFCGKAKPVKTLPVGCVLTMSAAGSESSNSCVITQEATKTKRGLGTELNRPVLAIMNPELTTTVPLYQIACGITDILAHIMERYFTNATEVDLTDRLCEAAMTAVIRAARIVMKDPKNYEAQAQLMWSSTIAHNNTLSVGRTADFASHQIEHELSAMYDVPHGAGLAVVFPAWMRYHLSANVMRFAQFATRVWGCEMNFENPEETALRGIETYVAFLKEIGMPTTMKELGGKAEDFRYMAEHTRKNNPAGFTGMCFPMTADDIEAVYRLADI